MNPANETRAAERERELELIHGEIDGRLSDAERTELAALVAVDPEMRALRDDLRHVVEQLEDLPELEPPGALRRAIRGALPRQAPADTAPASAPLAARLRRWLSGGETLRLAGVFAAGLAVGAIIIAPDAGLGLRELTGTMAAYDAGRDDAVDRLTMDLSVVAGSVGLHDRGSMYVLEYDLDTERPIEVVTAYSGEEGAFNGFAHIGDSNTRAVAEGRRVWLTVDGHRRYAIFLSRPRTQEGEIEIDFYAGEELLHRGSLRVPAMARAP
jgi:hypothetical protein